MTGQKTFILGIGAPKAGTTWVYSYLSAMPGASMGFAKEYHIWDATDVPNCHRYRVPWDQPILNSTVLVRREMQRHPEAYFAFFEERLRDPKARFTADWTPAYMGLGAERLRMIHRGFGARGIAVKVVFLMRDPVERTISMVRMIRDRKLNVVPGLDIDRPLADVVAAYAGSEDARTRTRYDATLANLALSGIPAADIHVALYEELFTPDALSALCRFLDVPCHPNLAGQRVNAARLPEGPLDDEVRSLVARRFSPAYRAAALRLPQVRTLWDGFRFLDAPVPRGAVASSTERLQGAEA